LSIIKPTLDNSNDESRLGLSQLITDEDRKVLSNKGDEEVSDISDSSHEFKPTEVQVKLTSLTNHI
jgi:hypothetical protein